jgi:hypothetical protein
MAPSVITSMNVRTTAMTVIATLPVPILKDPGHAHAIQVILVMAHYVPTLMSAQITDMTAIPMQHAQTPLAHGYVLVM